MEAPGITRRRRPRRPFLAPLWGVALMALAALGLTLGLTLLLVQFMGTTVVVLVHAPPEAAVAGDDSPLSAQDQQRAQSLAVMFGDAHRTGSLNALYVSDTPGARETLAPLAERLGAQPVPIPAASPARAVARMMREHSGGSVLLVASSDQVPAVVRALSGTELPPGPDDAGYILSIPTIGQASLVRFRY